MWLNALLLFAITFVAGLSVLKLDNLKKNRFKMVLSFSGAYLFSITVIHILPELLHEVDHIKIAGTFVLIGFFIQMILEYFSSGIEHGHLHAHSHGDNDHHHHFAYSILIALSIHSFLEGTLLVHPVHHHSHEGGVSLLLGLVLHKIPEAIALVTVAYSHTKNLYKTFFILLCYALMSPLGVIISGHIYQNELLSEELFHGLFGIVAGNFLYISTTIFFEAVPDHKFRANKLGLFLLAAATAIVVELYIN